MRFSRVPRNSLYIESHGIVNAVCRGLVVYMYQTLAAATQFYKFMTVMSINSEPDLDLNNYNNKSIS